MISQTAFDVNEEDKKTKRDQETDFQWAIRDTLAIAVSRTSPLLLISL